MKKRYRLKIALLMAAVLLPCASVLAQPHIGGSVYGGGNLGSVGKYVTSSDMKSFMWTNEDNPNPNSYTYNGTGICTVTIDAGTIGGNVYGAGKGDDDTYWCEKAMVYKTNVTINAGTINGTVYGGGQIGRVENNTTVTIGAASPANNTLTPTIAENVFGAGAGVATHGYSALVRGDASVTVQGYAQIGLNVYGGGEKASVGRFVIKGGLPSEPADDGSGDCIVNVQGNAVIGTNTDNNITDKGNVFGTCQGVTPPTSSEFTAYNKNYKSMQAVAQKAPDGTQGTAWDYVDGSDNKYYWVYYETLDAYQEFLNTLALASHPVVTIDGTLANETVTPSGNPTVNGSVFGGGQRGITLGTVAVNIAGGTVNKDVYGGGALADTNKGNWVEKGYVEATDIVEGATLTGTFYTRSGAGTEQSPYVYTETSDQTAGSGPYYRAAPTWSDPTRTSTIHPTTVNLTGGLIMGDAYGGGLGQKNGFNGASGDIDAVVYGDINVNLGSNGGSSATKFDISYYSTNSTVVKSGRVFGCNNLLGSPQGDVKVTVYRTVAGNVTRTTSDAITSNKALRNTYPDTYEDQEGYVPPTYEVAAVYGGGNLANYTATGKTAYVRIETCEVSIRDVYGGGNAAEVPSTNVLVRGAYEIQEVFGGGNGKDPYTTDGGTNWENNPGANVGNATTSGNATTLLTGGYIHEAYGGSNKKGTIYGNVSIDMGSGSSANNTNGACDLDVEKLVGAGKDADVNGDLIMVLGCKPDVKFPVLYAGADNANVNGDVELTITSGKYGKVFGGNNLGGIIMGHIFLNIEETGDCGVPIVIDELYLGGNQAMYSRYGYYKDGNTYKPRTSEDDEHTALTADDYGSEIRKTAPYAEPVLNVISCTYIGKVFGGGYGTGAALYGNPTVNINMIQGSHANNIHSFMANDPRLTALSLPSSDNPNNLGIIGDVYGGGNAADVIGNPTVNIGTTATVTLNSVDDDPATNDVNEHTPAVVGAYIVGNVFGGGMGKDDTFTCEKGMIGVDGEGIANPNGGTTVNIYNGTVRGNVYGGGEIGRVEKNTVVTIGTGNGVAPGSSSTPTSAPVIMGNVFGGGKGKETHGYAALVRGNPTVTVQGNAKVFKSVYGGGEIASVARYKVAESEEEANAHGVAIDMPYVLANNTSGNCIVTIRGYAEIGMDNMKMYHPDITDGTDKPDDYGHVFGAGKGILPGGEYDFVEGTTRRMISIKDNQGNIIGSDWEYFADEAAYIAFIQTLALASKTNVTITDNAFVKGSVYGGSENGLVQFDTNVKIQENCQIGNGDGINRRYTDTDWTAESLAECASWVYGLDTNNDNKKDLYAPYDPYANATGNLDQYSNGKSTEGGRRIASDGHTYYGNVFGGGSGSVPYFDEEEGISKYLSSAGLVKGNTYVTITGGHIMTNVYGGCEATNVLGVANVIMKGGTIGVPRTDAQIIDHPLTGYIFGGGKGDQRIFFNKDTNVKDAIVTVEGGRIYGSVYGGGEDGHVLRNTTVIIKETDATNYPTKIGTRGTSYYDGHVFGGGRGFGGEALTAGNVGGSVDLSILGGKILGSVYGGGRLASVGYGLYLVDEEITIDGNTVKPYGTMRPDNQYDGSYTNPSTDPAGTFYNKGRGRVTMTISGGTIGNDNEYAYDANNQLTHTKGGNVFAGGMGRMYKLDGTTPISSLDWWKLGNVKSTTLSISGSAIIKSNVYGGGELGQVVGYHTTKNAANADVNVGTEVIINGGTIGTEIKDGNTVKYTFGSVFAGGYGSLDEKLTHNAGTASESVSYPKYIAGRVLAGTKLNMTTGRVLASVYGGGEMAAVGESKALGETLTTNLTGDTHVIISGGTIGRINEGTTYFGGAKMGNVYGGGSGHNNTVRSGHIYGNTNVTISGSPNIYHNVYGGGAYGTVGDFVYTTTTVDGVPKVSGIEGLSTEHPNTGVATVTIKGGTIGINGKENGMVFGSSRGDINKPGERDDYTAWVYDTHVTIGTANATTGPTINGSVYGSGENGHTFNDAAVIINSGTIGIEEGAPITMSDNGTPNNTSDDIIYSGAQYPYRGNVYGGGCGTDKYYSNHSLEDHSGEGDSFNPLAGIVYGNTTVTVNGGHIVRNVYGAGAMGSVGKVTTATGSSTTTTSNGLTTINIKNGIIGVSGTVGDGNVFGAARGDKEAVGNDHATVRLANVKTTSVMVTNGTIKGNVYGGGEVGSVGTYSVTHDPSSTDYMKIYTFESGTGECNVTINGGTIGITGVAMGEDGTYANGNIYGASKGLANTFWCEKGMVYSTNVTINAGTINGTVYGGGQIGRVEHNSTVTIGVETPEGTTPAPTIAGNVFGAGAGLETHGYSALLRGNTAVTVQGNARVGLNVYGGGEKASVGRFKVPRGIPTEPEDGGDCIVNVRGGAIIGTNTDSNITNKGHVFGAGQGVTPRYYQDDIVEYNDTSLMPKRMMAVSMFNTSTSDQRYWRYVSDNDHNNVWEYLYTKQKYLDFLPTLALASHPVVTIGGALNEGTITPSGTPTVNGSVYGGGQRGITLGTVAVNIVGGTVSNDVYGGGALADTNKGNWDVTNNTWAQGKTSATYTTTVNMTGGTINGTAYGGGLGDANTEAIVYGDVKVNLNGLETVDYVASTHSSLVSPIDVDNDQTTDFYLVGSNAGCVVKGYIFGCNNVNGTPKGDVKVHIFKTLKRDANGVVLAKPNKNTNTYELAAVYGGGNNAAFVPADSYNGTAYNTNGTTKTHVIIDGCDLTSIEYVYGGGNAAPASGTQVTVNSCYEIGTLFAGGNGAGEGNPGANVGYLTDGTTAYGSGVALAVLHGGTIHKAFGGSNTLGNVRTSSTVKLDETDHALCPLCVDEVYGAGNNADQDGTSNIDLGCMEFLADMYGGAKNADVNNNIVLNIQSGRFNRVFGGNNLGGCVRGSITVNIEETGCHPIVIGQLYGGGNQAGYSVRGYKFDSTQNKWVPREATDDLENGMTAAFADPKVNVKSFTSIGEIYGGGYGESAVIVGNTNVIINECVGEHASDELIPKTDSNGNPVTEPDPDHEGQTRPVYTDVSANTGKWIHFVAGQEVTGQDGDGNDILGDKIETVWQPEHKSGEIGTIGNVFGGGNAAPVHGSTNVLIGQLSEVTFVTPTTKIVTHTETVDNQEVTTEVEEPTTDTDRTHTVIGVNITGNVYGGGNAALVTGDTNVIIGTGTPQ